MVQGRAGATGSPFNLGEMTVTRCVVVSPSGTMGFGFVAGRNARHAELAAHCDALLQDPSYHPILLSDVIVPLECALEQRRATEANRAAATRVEFFTLVRGDE